MNNRHQYILIFVLLLSNACISQKRTISSIEQKDISLFNDFKNYLAGSIDKKEDIGDTTHLKYVLLHYVFTNKKLDSSQERTFNDNELTADELKSLKKELTAFYNFLQEHQKNNLLQNITLKPIRLSNDTFIYNRLNRFQKVNTFIFSDKRSPNKTLGYVLFIPPIKNIIDNARIWSWTLLFKFGKYMFKSVTGEEGYEYIFSPEKFYN